MTYEFLVFMQDKQSKAFFSLYQIVSDESVEDSVINIYMRFNKRYSDYKIIYIRYLGIASFTLEV